MAYSHSYPHQPVHAGRSMMVALNTTTKKKKNGDQYNADVKTVSDHLEFKFVSALPKEMPVSPEHMAALHQELLVIFKRSTSEKDWIKNILSKWPGFFADMSLGLKGQMELIPKQLALPYVLEYRARAKGLQVSWLDIGRCLTAGMGYTYTKYMVQVWYNENRTPDQLPQQDQQDQQMPYPVSMYEEIGTRRVHSPDIITSHKQPRNFFLHSAPRHIVASPSGAAPMSGNILGQVAAVQTSSSFGGLDQNTPDIKEMLREIAELRQMKQTWQDRFQWLEAGSQKELAAVRKQNVELEDKVAALERGNAELENRLRQAEESHITWSSDLAMRPSSDIGDADASPAEAYQVDDSQPGPGDQSGDDRPPKNRIDSGVDLKWDFEKLLNGDGGMS